jgi:hypothetical protein
MCGLVDTCYWLVLKEDEKMTMLAVREDKLPYKLRYSCSLGPWSRGQLLM